MHVPEFFNCPAKLSNCPALHVGKYVFISVEPVVPTLRVDLVKGSPRLTAGGTAVEAEFEVSRPVAGVRCYLRSQSARDYKDCKPSHQCYII